jgi:hypothetical protein
MKLLRCLMLIVFLILSITIVSGAQDNATEESGELQSADSLAQSVPQSDSEFIIAYYLHGTRRCATCLKLEAFSLEALQKGFAEELSDSSIVWQVVNYDLKENQHYLKDYNLYTKSLILSRVRNGREVQWKNLDRIWELVHDKDKFINYVQAETSAFINRDDK